MENTQKIQISSYRWEVMEELVYEAEISSVADFIALTYRFDKKVKFKKPTDKNWYYGKTILKRLFKKEIAESKPLLKFVTTNDLELMNIKKITLYDYLMKKGPKLAYLFHHSGRMDEVQQIVDQVFGTGNKFTEAKEHPVHQMREAYLKMKKVYKIGRA